MVNFHCQEVLHQKYLIFKSREFLLGSSLWRVRGWIRLISQIVLKHIFFIICIKPKCSNNLFQPICSYFVLQFYQTYHNYENIKWMFLAQSIPVIVWCAKRGTHLQNHHHQNQYLPRLPHQILHWPELHLSAEEKVTILKMQYY